MIRPYTDQDTDAVVSIWRATSEVAHPFLSEAFLAAETENVRNVYPKFAEIWVLENHGQPIGFMTMIDKEVGAIFLGLACHGQGFGRAMMDFAVSRKGAVSLNVFEANTIGRAFYDRYGFRQTGKYLHEGSGQMTLQMAFTPDAG
jgi:putative acetyltransferase